MAKDAFAGTLNTERSEYANFHMRLLKASEVLLRYCARPPTLPKQSAPSSQTRIAVQALRNTMPELIQAAHEFTAEAADFDTFDSANILKLMKKDSDSITTIASAIADNQDAGSAEASADLASKERELQALTRDHVTLKREVEKLKAAYFSEEEQEVIKQLRKIIESQNLSIQYHMDKNATLLDALPGKGSLEILEDMVKDLEALTEIRDRQQVEQESMREGGYDAHQEVKTLFAPSHTSACQ